ncbi:hypothetical protein KC344_g166 [Hortaea werneckii]|nr:hypothetical protein KC344_g166 [Hortaea werneckii]
MVSGVACTSSKPVLMFCESATPVNSFVSCWLRFFLTSSIFLLPARFCLSAFWFGPEPSSAPTAINLQNTAIPRILECLGRRCGLDGRHFRCDNGCSLLARWWDRDGAEWEILRLSETAHKNIILALRGGAYNQHAFAASTLLLHNANQFADNRIAQLPALQGAGFLRFKFEWYSATLNALAHIIDECLCSLRDPALGIKVLRAVQRWLWSGPHHWKWAWCRACVYELRSANGNASDADALQRFAQLVSSVSSSSMSISSSSLGLPKGFTFRPEEASRIRSITDVFGGEIFNVIGVNANKVGMYDLRESPHILVHAKEEDCWPSVAIDSPARILASASKKTLSILLLSPQVLQVEVTISSLSPAPNLGTVRCFLLLPSGSPLQSSTRAPAAYEARTQAARLALADPPHAGLLIADARAPQ